MKDTIRGAITRLCQYRNVVKESGDGANKQRCNETKMEIDRLHILIKDKNSKDLIALTLAPEGKRKRERPKTTWRRMIEKEREGGGWEQ